LKKQPVLPDLLKTITPKWENIPNDHKVYQISYVCMYTKWPSNIPNGHKIYKHFPFQGPPWFIPNWDFGMKIYHLAILEAVGRQVSPFFPIVSLSQSSAMRRFLMFF
jgi:hypothetical protein